jgi:ribosomal protein L10
MSVIPHNAVPTKEYENQGQYDFWESLPVVEEVKHHYSTKWTYSRRFGDVTVQVEPAKPASSRWQRLKDAWYGGQPALAVTETEHFLMAEDLEETPLSEAERKAARAWCLEASDPVRTDGSPTPSEQKQQADKLVANFKRTHNPELIEAIKKLPSASELLLKFKRELTDTEKRTIRQVAQAIVTKKPVKMDVVYPGGRPLT